MITANAIAAIDWLFEQSIRQHSTAGPEDICAIDIMPDAGPGSSQGKRHLVALTISSYLFRLVALFDFDTQEATTAHLARMAGKPDQQLDGQALGDAYAEMVNMICGGVNRGLAAVFRHSGMSTPFVLESTCAGYLPMLDPTQGRLLKVAINDSVRFDIMLCTCVAAGTTLDFHIDRHQIEDTSAGELELF